MARRHACGCPYESDRVGDPSSPTPDSLSWRMPPRAGPEESPSMGRQRPSRCPRMRNRQVPNYPEPDLPSLSHERACRSAPMACHTSLGHGERTDGLRRKVGPARLLPERVSTGSSTTCSQMLSGTLRSRTELGPYLWRCRTRSPVPRRWSVARPLMRRSTPRLIVDHGAPDRSRGAIR